MGYHKYWEWNVITWAGFAYKILSLHTLDNGLSQTETCSVVLIKYSCVDWSFVVLESFVSTVRVHQPVTYKKACIRQCEYTL
jgi:hypothetical protein